MSEHLDFLGAGNTTIVIIVFLSIVVRYLFASGGAYVAAMVPVFATVGLVTGTAPALLALAILFSNSYGGCITHYGGAAGPIIFAAGYNDIKSSVVNRDHNRFINVSAAYGCRHSVVGLFDSARNTLRPALFFIT